MRTQRRNYRRRRGFEFLESRHLLAGDVFVEAGEGGDLVITGDDNDNFVVIEGTGVDGEYVVTGDDGTNIFLNGVQQPGATVTVSGATGSIIVDLNAGNDTLHMNNVSVGDDDIVILMDEGADIVRLGAWETYANGTGGADVIDPAIGPESGSVGVNGLLDIDLGTGADLLQLVRVFGDGDWSITLGDDDDSTSNLTDNNPNNDIIPGVALDDQAYIFVGSADSVDLQGGTGDDLVNVNYLGADAVNIDGGAGNDVLSVAGSVFNVDVNLFSGSGIDTIAFDFSRVDGEGSVLEIDSGADDDFVLVARSIIADGDAVIRSGGGFDDVVFGRFYANAQGQLTTGGNSIESVSLDTGGEGDFTDIRGNVVDEFFGVFGGGNDDVDFINNQVNSNGLLDGGGGFDSLTFLGNLISGDFDIIGFEQRNGTFNPDA
jgi:hypothetical protein